MFFLYLCFLLLIISCALLPFVKWYGTLSSQVNLGFRYMNCTLQGVSVSSHQGCTNPVCQVTVATKFFMVAPRIFRWLLDLWTICAPLLYNTCWLGWNILAAREISSKYSSCTVQSWGM